MRFATLSEALHRIKLGRIGGQADQLAVLQKLSRNKRSMEWPSYGLSGSHSKEPGDQYNLACYISFFHPVHLSFSHHVHDLISL